MAARRGALEKGLLMRWLVRAATSAALLTLATTASATVVTFDDLSGDGPVPDGYAGITWNGQWSYTSGVQAPYTPASPPTRIYDALPAGQFDFSAPVTFDGAYFVGYPEATVQFQLYLDGALVGASSVLAPSSTPTFLTSGYSGAVDEVRVVTLGAGRFDMDNVTFNSISTAIPEPATWTMLLLGFFGLGAALRARPRAVATA
jgi:hypothetical protein